MSSASPCPISYALSGNKVPDKGTTIKVIYCEDKPSKARIEL
jgi:hypothetical protein